MKLAGPFFRRALERHKGALWFWSGGAESRPRPLFGDSRFGFSKRPLVCQVSRQEFSALLSQVRAEAGSQSGGKVPSRTAVRFGSDRRWPRPNCFVAPESRARSPCREGRGDAHSLCVAVRLVFHLHDLHHVQVDGLVGLGDGQHGVHHRLQCTHTHESDCIEKHGHTSSLLLERDSIGPRAFASMRKVSNFPLRMTRVQRGSTDAA